MSSTEELVGLVLAALHPRLRERCTKSKILAVLEELYIMMALDFFRACGAQPVSKVPHGQPASFYDELRNCAEIQH